MKQSRAIQKSEYNFESTGYDNSASQTGVWVIFSVLVALWQWYLTLMTPTACRVYDNGTWHWWPRLPVVSTFLYRATSIL